MDLRVGAVCLEPLSRSLCGAVCLLAFGTAWFLLFALPPRPPLCVDVGNLREEGRPRASAGFLRQTWRGERKEAPIFVVVAVFTFNASLSLVRQGCLVNGCEARNGQLKEVIVVSDAHLASSVTKLDRCRSCCWGGRRMLGFGAESRRLRNRLQQDVQRSCAAMADCGS